VQFGVVPPSDVTTVINYILSMPFSPPVVSAADVLDALRITGRDRDILHILTDASEPGWANILAQGGTFTWEMWKPKDQDVLTPPLASLLGNGDSRSHGFGSNVLVAIQQTLLGVLPTAPGYASFAVTVPLHALSYASGQVPTPHGAIGVAWTRPAVATRPFKVDVTVPANTTASIGIPALSLDNVRESGMALRRQEGITAASIDGDYAVVEVGAGSYHFTSTNVPVAAIGTGDGSPQSNPQGGTHVLGDSSAAWIAVVLGALGLVALGGARLFKRRGRSAGV